MKKRIISVTILFAVFGIWCRYHVSVRERVGSISHIRMFPANGTVFVTATFGFGRDTTIICEGVSQLSEIVGLIQKLKLQQLNLSIHIDKVCVRYSDSLEAFDYMQGSIDQPNTGHLDDAIPMLGGENLPYDSIREEKDGRILVPYGLERTNYDYAASGTIYFNETSGRRFGAQHFKSGGP